jgi:hypothetical protein
VTNDERRVPPEIFRFPPLPPVQQVPPHAPPIQVQVIVPRVPPINLRTAHPEPGREFLTRPIPEPGRREVVLRPRPRIQAPSKEPEVLVLRPRPVVTPELAYERSSAENLNRVIRQILGV